MEKILVSNKKAFFNYNIIEKFQAGIELKGCEVKSIIASQCSLDGAFCFVKKDEIFIINMCVDPWKTKNTFKTIEPLRTRKLLLNKNEIIKISRYLKTHSATIIPISINKTNRYIKLTIGICTKKNNKDKRETIKNRDRNREMKNYL